LYVFFAARTTYFFVAMVDITHDSRYQEREGLLTVLAINTRPEDLPADYMAKRMEGGR
jgi:hypothetical protein